MATVNVQSVKAQLDEYIAKNTSLISAGVYSDEIQLNKYCKTISQVKGKYPQFHKILTHVVQGFKPEWQKLGEMQFRAKALQNFRQKVNLEIIVDEIYNTWLSELKIEGKKPEDQPLSKVIISDLLAKVIDDLDDLSVTADSTAGTPDGNFGYSLNGISKVVNLASANTDNPVFTIPLSAITSANILDEFKTYERGIPNKTRKKVKYIFCSENVKLMYGDAYVDKYGEHTTHSDDRMYKTETYKYEIVGLDGLPDDVIFATTEGNMLKLVDVFDNEPAITDTQIQDYVLKIFMEWHLGYDFMINELVYVADFGGVKHRGLNDATLNALYYDSENLTTA